MIVLMLGWIVGISTMGYVLNSSFLNFATWCWLFSILSLILSFSYFQCIQHYSLKTIRCFLLGLSAFYLGQFFAQTALNERLQMRVNDASEISYIVYIDKIDESAYVSRPDRIKQRATILSENGHHFDLMLYAKTSKTTVNGRFKRDDSRDDSSDKFKFDGSSAIQNAEHALSISENAGDDPGRLKTTQHNPFQLGHYYHIQGELKPSHSYAVAGVFDIEKWLLQQNIMGTVNIRSIQPLAVAEVESFGFNKHIRDQKSLIAQFKLYTEKQRLEFRNLFLDKSLTNKGLVLALLTGDESLLSDAVQNQFKTLGISHLLAISGPHVLIFAVILCFILNALITRLRPQIFLSIPRPYLWVIPFFCCVFLYTAFVGFEIPALRTLLTVTILSVVVLFKQQVHALKLLLCSASILLLFDPFSILSAAFWLSYGACFILIRVYQTLTKKTEDIAFDQPAHNNHSRIIIWARMLFDSQWKVFIALFPLVAIIFQQISWISPWVNLLAIPLIGVVIVPLEVVGAISYFIAEPLALLFFHLADYAISLLLGCLNLFEKIFNPQLSWLALTPLIIVLMALGIFILFLPRGVVPKYWAAFCILPLLFPIKNNLSFNLTILDVGQGQAIFVQNDQKNILIDTGGSFDEAKFSIGRQVVLPYLFNRGVASIDRLYLTHLDQDHAGAFDSIQQAMKIKTVYSNEIDARFNAKNFEYCYAGQIWNMPDVKLEVLMPTQEQLLNVSQNRNELSCVIYIQVFNAGQYKNFLLMGDAGWQTEYELLKMYPDLNVDVLVLGHHGSQHSSSYAFLKHLKPKLAVISAGFGNQYNHPHPIVINRLQQLSIPHLNTIQHGSIKFQIDQKNEMDFEVYRKKRQWLDRGD